MTNAITATRTELAAAFEEWARRFEADPESFGPCESGDGYGARCADLLIELLATEQNS